MAIAAGKVRPVDQTKRGSPGSVQDALVCAVLFVDLVASSKKSIAEQTLAKRWLNTALLSAMRGVYPTDRIILDAGDGVAVSFFCDAGFALRVGLELLSSLGDLGSHGKTIEARIGINLGPVCLVQDVNGQNNIIGDGINAAQRVMSFARPGQVLVSRSYHNLLVGTSERYAGFFAYQGLRVDKHSREHEIYAVVATVGDLHKATTRAAQFMPLASAKSLSTPSKKSYITRFDVSYGKRVHWQGCAGILLFLGAAAATFHWGDWREPDDTGATTLTREMTRVGVAPPAPAPPSAHGAQAPALPTFAHWEEQRATRRAKVVVTELRMKRTYTEHTASQHGTALVQLAISPWGEVRVDGKSVGVSPPLSRLELGPGLHRIEIKNGGLQPYLQTLQLQPSQTIKLKHKFTELERAASLR